MAVDHLPEHDFTPTYDSGDDMSGDAICMATLQTATLAEDGYDMITQCGHTRAEHGLPSSPKTPTETT